MGGNLYNSSSRSARTVMYMNQSFDDTFVQQREGKIHKSMDPAEALLREARDSEVHPESLPIIFGLDVTASMDYIPKMMIQKGLPKLISGLHEKNILHPAVLFMGIGDSRGRRMSRYTQVDDAPLQVGQFESGDEQLDDWLTKCWIEGGGWGNGGESYAWAWWFAAKRCVTDAWEKRKQKGFLFTTGDDKCFGIESDEFQRVLNINHEPASREDLYKEASEKWNVYHLCLARNSNACSDWNSFMGENCIVVENHEDIPDIMAKIIAEGVSGKTTSTVVGTQSFNDQKITL